MLVEKLAVLLFASVKVSAITASDLSTAPMLAGSVAENVLTLLAITVVPVQVVSLVVVSINCLLALRQYITQAAPVQPEGANQSPVVLAAGVVKILGARLRALSVMRSKAKRP